MVSPSRFSVLATLNEEIEDTKVEEGEVVPEGEQTEMADAENKHTEMADTDKLADQVENQNRRTGKQQTVVAHKSNKKKVVRTKDLKFVNAQSTSKSFR